MNLDPSPKRGSTQNHWTGELFQVHVGQNVPHNPSFNYIEIRKCIYGWTSVEEKEFELIKIIVARDVFLEYLNFNQWFEIHTDASDCQLSAAIFLGRKISWILQPKSYMDSDQVHCNRKITTYCCRNISNYFH